MCRLVVAGPSPRKNATNIIDLVDRGVENSDDRKTLNKYLDDAKKVSQCCFFTYLECEGDEDPFHDIIFRLLDGLVQDKRDCRCLHRIYVSGLQGSSDRMSAKRPKKYQHQVKMRIINSGCTMDMCIGRVCNKSGLMR